VLITDTDDSAFTTEVRVVFYDDFVIHISSTF